MTSLRSLSIALVVAGATATALAEPPLAEPRPSQHPRVGQLAELTFAPGSAELAVEVDARFRDKLGQAIAWAEEHPDGLLVLDGHADPAGEQARNVRLSLRRARAVRDQLVAAGANPDQIVIAAFGEDERAAKRDRSRVRHGRRATASPGNPRRVVIWGTRSGMDAVVARTLIGGDAVIWNGPVSEPERQPQPGARPVRRPR